MCKEIQQDAGRSRDVGVFCCGPLGLRKSIQQATEEHSVNGFNLIFNSEKFA
jgi:hypothetical protein